MDKESDLLSSESEVLIRDSKRRIERYLGGLSYEPQYNATPLNESQFLFDVRLSVGNRTFEAEAKAGTLWLAKYPW